MNCAVCRGACCEETEIELTPRSRADAEWFRVRLGNENENENGKVLLPLSRCPQLTAEGRCAIHFTSKPVVCVLFEPGGEGCLEALEKRRTPEQIKEISRDD